MDKNIFENGWNAQNAYVFGWIMSDGCLMLEGRNKTSFAVRICSNDLDIIEYLHGYMCDGNKIYKQNENGFLIKYRNKDSISFMQGHGLTERKSLSMQFPNLPEDVVRHFVRGYFDGDGSIVITHNKYNTYGQASFTSGSVEFLESLQKKLEENDIASHLYNDGRHNSKSHYLKVVKWSELEKLYHFLYDDADGSGVLKRKYDKYTKLMNCKRKYKSHII